MKTENQTISSTSSNFSNSNVSLDSKYDGLINQDVSKKVRNRLFILLGYIDGAGLSLKALHSVITFFRFFQFLGPSLIAASSRYWNPETLQGKVISYVSVIFHLVPVEYRDKAAIFIEYIYSFFIIFYFVLVISSACVYRATSKLPNSIVILISILNASFMYVAHPISLQMAFQVASTLIAGQKTAYNKYAEIIAIVLTTLCAFAYLFIYRKVMSITLVFRPTSMMTTSNRPSVWFLVSTFAVTILSAFATNLPKIAFIILMILCAAIMFCSTMIVFMPGSYMKKIDGLLVLSSCLAGGFQFLIDAIMAILDKEAGMIMIFVFLGIFLISILSSNFIINAFDRKCLKDLDSIADDPTLIDALKSPANMIRIACVGFKFAHPICIDWSIFRNASEIWPESVMLWSLFGKFVAIYPEENKLLSYIIHNIEAKKLKGGVAKQTIAQGRMILTQRETSLSTELKRKMQKVGKAVQNSKRKLRHIWDLVIQGNTREMENAVNNAYASIQKTQADFNHVLGEYPNNRFIARAYVRFLQEITANHKEFVEWVEKLKILQRGIAASIDNSNALGIAAFPQLPAVIATKSEGMTNAVETESAFSIETDLDDDAMQMNEQMSGIRDQILHLKIPALKTTTIMSLIIFFIFILAPSIAIFIIAPTFIDGLNEPLKFMYYLSYLRVLNYQIPSFAFHWIFESYPPEKPIFEKPNYSDVTTTSLGGYSTTLDQFKYLIKELTTSLEAIGQFRSFEANNEILRPAKDYTFKSILKYYFYDVNGNYTIINVSIQSGLMDYSLQLSKLSEVDKLTPAIIHSNLIMNAVTNVDTIGNSISSGISSIIEYLDSVNNNMQKTMMIVLIALSFFFALFYIILTIYEMRALQSNKNEIYKCLTSLPKNVVSSLAESLRVLKKDTEGSRSTEADTDVSKQEENILKIFAAAGDSSAITAEKYFYIVGNIIFLAIDILITYFFTSMFMTVTVKLRENGPQLDYALGAPAYMMGSVNCLNMATASLSGCFTYITDAFGILGKLTIRTNYLTDYYHQSRYGGASESDPPFIYFDEINQLAADTFTCEDENSIPKGLKEVYTCFDADQQTTLFQALSEKIARPVLTNESQIIDTEDGLLTEIWYMTAVLLYESFFSPMFHRILPGLRSTMNSAIPDTLPIIVILLIIAFIIVIVINVIVSNDAAKLRFALSLLLHCPVNIVTQTQKISEVLNGNFSDRYRDSTTRSAEFFHSVVSHLPDSIIIVNSQNQIISINKSTERIYDVTAEEILNKDAVEFFTSNKFDSDVSQIISMSNKPPIEAEYTVSDGTMLHVELSCLSFNQNSIITTRDRTQAFTYNTLIKEEKSKSDKLLASILPASLVPRVQSGEKNISFAVQSASILFLDIVEFTPWCASNTASMVMATLNNLFKLLDNKVALHSTLTKIKCIGDCYMSAGGIFAESNQPTIHAKEMTEFGLEAIDCLTELNQQIGQKLRIRVGINTGGPIVAGVLGTEKPTFEILGPAINMAQQMEHHGVPMQVHISRSVYELIYGGNFSIKERGQIEIKSGKVITYLVEREQNSK